MLGVISCLTTGTGKESMTAQIEYKHTGNRLVSQLAQSERWPPAAGRLVGISRSYPQRADIRIGMSARCITVGGH